MDWRQSYNFAVGDTVLIKKEGKPKTFYTFTVVKTLIDDENTLDEERFWTDKEIYYSGLGQYKYVRLKLVKREMAEMEEESQLLKEDEPDFVEGAKKRAESNLYERNKDAREACIRLKGCRCAVCGFDFEAVYGAIGRDFIHVHHLVPVSSIGKQYTVNPATDLVPVCPNCHNMLHRQDPPFTPEELKAIMMKK